MVWEATIADLADLQRWLRSQSPDPLLSLEPALDERGLTPARRVALVDAAHDLAVSWPVHLYSAESGALLSSDEGICFFFYVALRRGLPHLTPDAAVEAACSMTSVHEYYALYRAFYGVDSVRVVKRMAWSPEALALLGGGDTAAPLSWDEAVFDVADCLKVPLREVFGMTLTEFGLVRRRGAPPDGGDVRVPPHLMRRFEELQAKYLGVPLPAPPAPAEAPPVAVDPPGLMLGARYGGGPEARAAWEARAAEGSGPLGREEGGA